MLRTMRIPQRLVNLFPRLVFAMYDNNWYTAHLVRKGDPFLWFGLEPAFAHVDTQGNLL